MSERNATGEAGLTVERLTEINEHLRESEKNLRIIKDSLPKVPAQEERSLVKDGALAVKHGARHAFGFLGNIRERIHEIGSREALITAQQRNINEQGEMARREVIERLERANPIERK